MPRRGEISETGKNGPNLIFKTGEYFGAASETGGAKIIRAPCKMSSAARYEKNTFLGASDSIFQIALVNSF